MAELCQRHSTLKHFWLVFLLNRDSAFRYFTLKRCRFVIFFDVLGVYSRSLRRVFTAVEHGRAMGECRRSGSSTTLTVSGQRSSSPGASLEAKVEGSEDTGSVTQ